MITKTEAIVLKSMKYRDTSKIVTFYSRDFGKLRGIAKGARQAKSKFGASLDPLTHVSLVYYRKDQRELQLISQCDTIGSLRHIRDDLEKMAAALALLELVDQVTHEEGNEVLFTLLVESLLGIENAPKNPVNITYAFALRCLSLLGFRPSLDSCAGCGKMLNQLEGENSVLFSLSRGAIACRPCSGHAVAGGRSQKLRGSKEGYDAKMVRGGDSTIRISLVLARTLSFLLHAPMPNVTALELSIAQGNEINGTLRLYLRQHFENMRPVKALDLLRNFDTLRS